MSDEVMLKEAIEAIRQGNNERARDLLTRLLRNDQNNPTYWLWMSAAVETRKEKIYCLKSVLRLDPANARARQGLVLFGGMPPDPNQKIKHLTPKPWKVNYGIEHERPGLSSILAGAGFQPVAVLLSVVVIGFLVFVSILLLQKKAIPIYVPPTNTPGPAPTFSPTPTFIGYVAPAANPALTSTLQVTPLWMLLDATYTPTPIYVNTPHAISEAYRAGMLAFNQGQWAEALKYLQQAVELEPSADIYYYMGETYRLQGNSRQALTTYTQSLRADINFAPSYLGKARANLMLNPKVDVGKDLNQAVKNDPNYGEAYLERAIYRFNHNDLPGSAQDLDSASNLLPGSPLPYLYRARLEILQEEFSQALTDAKKAYDLDRTLLPAYRYYGEAALENGELDTARQVLKTYLSYENRDSNAWLLYSRAQAGLGRVEDIEQRLLQVDNHLDNSGALQSIGKVTVGPSTKVSFYLYRATIELAASHGQEAVNDFLLSRQYVFNLLDAQNRKPLWFAYNLALGRALFLAGRESSALDQINFASTLAKTDPQRAAVYYWRAQVYDALGNSGLAARDWKALAALPVKNELPSWISTAQVHVSTLTAPTITLTPTITRTPLPKPSQTASRTLRPSPSPTPTRTLKPTLTPTATRTSTPTPTATPPVSGRLRPAVEWY